jgi:hypothetical protein
MRAGNELDAGPAGASASAADEREGGLTPGLTPWGNPPAPLPPAVVAQVRGMITRAALVAELEAPARLGAVDASSKSCSEGLLRGTRGAVRISGLQANLRGPTLGRIGMGET